MTSLLHRTTGMALLHQGKHQASAEAFYKALPMIAELGGDLGVGFCLEMTGWLAGRQHRHERAAWILGAAGAAVERTGEHVNLYQALAGPHQQAEAAVRDALGADRYAALYQLGFRYPLDQLIPLVISDADKLPQARPELVGTDNLDPLTARETEIVALVAEGLSNREIAARLVISKRTVDAHVEHIYAKLGISSRVQLVNWLKP
jgi:DNA-binding CsgD family transcriptional regulator